MKAADRKRQERDDARRFRRTQRRKEAAALKQAARMMDANPATLNTKQRMARQVAIFGGKAE